MRIRPNLTAGDGIAIAGMFIGIALAVAQFTSAEKTAQMQNRQNQAIAEMQKKQNFVQIAVGVLSQKSPTDKDGKRELFPENEQALRRWSVAVLDENAPSTKIPEAAKTALIQGVSELEKWNYGTGSWGSWGGESTAYYYEPLYGPEPRKDKTGPAIGPRSKQ